MRIVFRVSLLTLTLLAAGRAYAGDDEIANPAPQPTEQIPVVQAPPLGPVARMTSFLGRERTAFSKLAAEHPGVAILSTAYIATGVMDWQSTTRVIGQGGVELNPIVGPMADNSAAYLAFKTAMTSLSLYAVHRTWQHNHAAAIATLVALTAAQGFVAGHNYSLLQR